MYRDYFSKKIANRFMIYSSWLMQWLIRKVVHHFTEPLSKRTVGWHCLEWAMSEKASLTCDFGVLISY